MAQQPFDLYALDPAAKRAMEAEDRFKADLKTKNKFRARPKTGATASAPRRGGIERTADRMAAFGVPLSITEAIKDVDRNLLGFDETAQSLRNIIGGDGSAGDYVNAALSLPVIGGLAAKPVEMLAAKAGRGLARAGERALASRAGRYLTEARPLLDNADDAIETAFTVTPGVQRRITNQRPVVQGLPAPEQRLGLPAPGPGLPSFAVKPKGGQWWADKYIGAVRPSDLGVKVGRLPDDGRWFAKDGEGRLMLFDTEDQARSMSQNWVDSFNKNASVERAVRRIADNRLGLVSDANGPLSQLQSWFLRAAPRYIKNEMGTAEDPMRALAERGALHVALSPDEWSQAAGDVIKSDTIGDVLGLNQLYPKEGAMPGAGDDFRASVVTNMPWLTKAPVTDQVYRIGDTHTLEDKMGLAHILDEMRNAMHERSDLPADLAVRPESLQRMGLPQAAERVALINQWRAKEMERAALDAQNNPVTHVFKEYAENNPKGLRWVEMAPPKGDAPTNYDVEEELAKALKYEGDTMGHCVGGYCPDVMSGQSRIFSLRDAKGEPHVTIETKPGDQSELYRQAIADLRDTNYWDAWLENQRLNSQNPGNTKDLMDYMNEFRVKQGLEPLNLSVPYDIKQIKGKQNLKPKDDYLPFVQDFVKSGQWGRVGDFENTGLFNPQAALDAVRATREIHPDQQRQLIERIVDTISGEGGNPDVIDEWDAPRGFEDVWHAAVKAGRGYARGGRAFAAKPCSCDHSLAVR